MLHDRKANEATRQDWHFHATHPELKGNAELRYADYKLTSNFITNWTKPLRLSTVGMNLLKIRTIASIVSAFKVLVNTVSGGVHWGGRILVTIKNLG